MRSMSASLYQPSLLGDGHEVLVHVGHHHAGLVAHERHGEERLEPDEQPAMMEIVPVGATVVTLQLRSSCMGRMRSPCSSRAQVSSGPQMERAHSGNAPRSWPAARSPSWPRRRRTPSRGGPSPRPRAVVRDAEADEHVGEAHHAQADAADALRERVDLGQRVLVDVDDVVEEVRRQVDVARRRPSPSRRLHVVADVDRAEVADVVGSSGCSPHGLVAS
jgi:hypothetical protein